MTIALVLLLALGLVPALAVVAQYTYREDAYRHYGH